MPRDPYRPRYHFTPPSGWMNDPNGPIQWQGRYHMFYQYNPSDTVWGNLHWGHAISDDLVRWQHMPIALEIPEDALHRNGVWSGCSVAAGDGSAAILYSTHDPSTVCLARSRDGDLRTWVRHAANPVIPGLPEAAGPSDIFRDPFCWREGSEWRMVIGGGLWDENGSGFLFRSRDLERWDYLGRLAQGPGPGGDPEWRGVWECPLFWPLNNRFALVASSLDIRSDPPQARVLAMSGSYDGSRFEPMVRHRFDYGDAFYAPNLLRTDEGRTVLWAWLRECRSGELGRASSWSGCLTLPREVRLDGEARLVMEPAPEVKLLRKATHRWRPDGADPATWLSAHEGSCLEIELAWAGTAQGERGIAVSVAEDGSEETRVLHDRKRGVLFVERSDSRTQGSSLTRSETLCAPLPLPTGSPTRLRIFLDRTVLEVFTGTTACISTRIYPAYRGRGGLRLIGNAEDLTALSLHEMA